MNVARSAGELHNHSKHKKARTLYVMRFFCATKDDKGSIHLTKDAVRFIMSVTGVACDVTS